MEVRTLFTTGALISLQEARWKGKNTIFMKSHKLFYCGNGKSIREFGVPFVVDGNMKRSVLDFEAVERICVVRIKQTFTTKVLSSYRGKG
jgi:hypothetical protein